jgi:serine/threonine protein kinase
MGPEYRHATRAHKQPTDLLAPNVGAAPEPRHRFDAGVGAGRPRGAWSVASGTTVAGTYQILRLLGQGGMGAVWEATHLRLPDKRVVVKVLLFGTTDRQKPPLWIQGKKQLTLTEVPIESVDEKTGEPINNYQLIYKRAGGLPRSEAGQPLRRPVRRPPLTRARRARTRGDNRP